LDVKEDGTMVQHLFRKLFENQIATKVAMTILLIVFISTLFNSFFYYMSASKVVKENVRESSLQITRQAADSLSFIFSIGSDMSDLVYSNERLQEIVLQDSNENLSFMDRSKNNEDITSLLNSNIYSSSFVRIIYVLRENGTSWGSGTFSTYKLAKYEIEELDWAKESVKKDGEVVWQGLQYDQFSGAGENTELILPISRVMKDFNNLENIGYLRVALDGSAILEKINDLKLGKTGRFFVVDQQGKVMIDSNLENINRDLSTVNESLYSHIMNQQTYEFEFNHDEIDYYGVKQEISNGWTIVGVVPIHEITGELISIRKITISISVLLGLVCILIGIYASRRVTQPINVLTKQMKLVGEGNFTVRTKVQTNDEIGMMSLQFNRMIIQIDKLLAQVKEEQSQKREAELRAVRHRINPHFLFNTLSTIRWLVRFHQTERANNALSALIRLLEANMGKKGTFVTIKEELDIVEKFMAIMQIRYEQTFHLNLVVDEGVEDFLIPQMLIQPLVENAIFHGFVPIGKEGTITITVSQYEDGITIIVDDDGIGIKSEVLENFIQSSKPSTSYVGIGLLHVYDSINLYFDSRSSIRFDSDTNGTNVVLILKPKNGVGNDV
jgi:two-component system, sensor histidine kinase YesM